jgi:transposase
LVPRKPGDHVKTDRRDAAKLARGELDTAPDAGHEAMRDLVRSRADAMQHLTATKQHLQSFLLRHGLVFEGEKHWTRGHYRWLAERKFEHPAHQMVFQDYINAIRDAEQHHDQLVQQIIQLVPGWSMRPLVEALCTIRGINLIAA